MKVRETFFFKPNFVKKNWLWFLIAGSSLFFLFTSFRILSNFLASTAFLFSEPGKINKFLFLSETLRSWEHAFDNLAWLAPLCLVLGVWFQGSGQATAGKPEKNPEKNPVKAKVRGRANLVAGAILLGSGLIRLIPLLNPDWLGIRADYDEGVHLMGARLLVTGAAPYRDFFFPQPPGALLGLVPAALLGGGGPGLIWLARFTSVGWAWGAGWLAWLTGRRLGGNLTGLIALAVLELDGIGVFTGHQALFEWQLNFFSLLTIWAFLRYSEKSLSRANRAPGYSENADWLKLFTGKIKQEIRAEGWLLLAGLLLAFTFLTKLNGSLVGVAVGICYCLSGNLKKALKLAFITGLASIGFLAPFFLRGGLELVRQVFFFQLLRGPDGIEKSARFDSFAFDARPYSVSGNSALTLLLAWLGIGGWLALARKKPGNFAGKPLMLIGIWGSLILGFLSFNATFFVHYYVTLLPVLALGAGGLAGWVKVLNWKKAGTWLAAFIIALFSLPALITQASALTETGESPAPRELANFITQVASPGTPVQSFDMLYNLAGNRPLPQNGDGRYLIDSYGGLQYEAYGIANRGIGRLMGEVLGKDRISSNHTYVQNSKEAQTFLTHLFATAGLVILDERGRDFTSPETEGKLRSFSVTLVNNQILTAYASGLNGARKAANQWIALNLPRNSKILLEPGSTYLNGLFQVELGTDAWQHPPGWYQERGYSYLLLSSESYGRYFRNPGRFQAQIKGYNQLAQAGQMATFLESSGEDPGSTKSLPLDGEAGRLDLIALPGAPPLAPLEKHQVPNRFENSLTLESFALPKVVKAGQTLALDLSWRKLAGGPRDTAGIKFFVHLVDAGGKIVAQRDNFLGLGKFSALDWPSGQEFLLDGDLELPAELPVGEYRLELGLYYEETGERLSIIQPGVAKENKLDLATFSLQKS